MTKSETAQKLLHQANQSIKIYKYKNALKYIKDAFEINPKNAEIMSTMGLVHCLLSYSELSQEKTFKLLENALELEHKNPFIWAYMGIGYYDKNQKDKAVECYKKAIEIDSNNLFALAALSVYYFSQKKMMNTINY